MARASIKNNGTTVKPVMVQASLHDSLLDSCCLHVLKRSLPYMVFLIGDWWLLFTSIIIIFFLPPLFWAGILLGLRRLRNPRTSTKITAAFKQAQGINFQNFLIVVVFFYAHTQYIHRWHKNAWYYYFFFIAFSEQSLQYSLLQYIPSLMSKQASSVAKLSQVMQFLFSYLHLHLQIVSVISKILPFTFTVRLLISAINRDTAITTPPIIKNLLLLSFLSVIAHQRLADHEIVVIIRCQNSSFYSVLSHAIKNEDSVCVSNNTSGPLISRVYLFFSF